MNIPRLVQQQITAKLGSQKVLMLYGTRRTGKTTIIENIVSKYPDDALLLQGEDMQVSEILQRRTIANYSQLTAGKKIVIIDEAQSIPEIGKCLKLLIDGIKGITVIVTGSSSFDLAYATGEPLVGRNLVYQLYPIAQAELSSVEDYLTTTRNLEQRLVYGSYPELWHIDNFQEKENYLKQMVSSYLLKDLLTMENVKGADVLYRLLQLLAWQVGSQVSTVELGNSLQLNKITVERYLDLLTKVFIIYPLTGYSNNLRKEVTKSKKWYFFDNGIRNALINNFSDLSQRNDVGQLWEQYLLSERIKNNAYRGHSPQYFFWRTYDGQEIDLIESHNGKLKAFEFKWKNNKVKIPAAFGKAYPDAQFTVINQENYLNWVTAEH
ncbi:ATP-binding protein [Mucilaginibacter sp.]|uniref:ATP-binding protein n=1 Tax=Mucilaginibacter sp. TaxID=1882438 RepID=UPI00283D40A7|nr:ATP-binding protein [Mucilaginibacter sp.]MDR3694503.1 ATP-binding protein [Mucilaginibacter sp.]